MKLKHFVVYMVVVLLVFSQTAVSFGAAETSEKPAAPTMNSAVCADDGSVDVVWSKVSGADKYEIYRAVSSKGTYKKIATVSGKNRTYKDTDVKLYKNYYYKVKTVDNGEKSKYSKVVSAYTEGFCIPNSKIEFLLTFPNGEKGVWPAGDGVITTSPTINVTVKYKGKATSDYTVIYDKANVNIKKDAKGRVNIMPKTAGNYLFTFKVGEEKATFAYHAELAKEGNVKFHWRQRPEDQNSMSVKIPEYRESVLTMKAGGKKISDFKVTTSNKNVCTVKKNGSQVTVTNKGPGKCRITVNYKGQKTVFHWLVKDGKATAPFTYAGDIAVTGTLSKEDAEKAVDRFAEAECSKKEIKSLVKKNLTLEEAAEKISTVADAVNYLCERGYYFDYSYTPGMDYKDLGWSWNLSAEFGFKENAGCCGGTANLINRLLKGDYESQGYVQVPGHVYNYFYSDGLYYFCDFVGPSTSPFEIGNTDRSASSYLLFAADSVEEYGEYQKITHPGYADLLSEDRLVFTYTYPMDGEDMLPRGNEGKYDRTAAGGAIWHYLPESIRDVVEYAYLEDGFEFSFAEAPTPDMYPPEINIPKD